MKTIKIILYIVILSSNTNSQTYITTEPNKSRLGIGVLLSQKNVYGKTAIAKMKYTDFNAINIKIGGGVKLKYENLLFLIGFNYNEFINVRNNSQEVRFRNLKKYTFELGVSTVIYKNWYILAMSDVIDAQFAIGIGLDIKSVKNAKKTNN